MLIKYKRRSGSITIETPCPFINDGTRVGSIACGECRYHVWESPLLKLVWCRRKRSKS